MKALKEYRIPFLGLKQGEHTYEFHLTDTFFGNFEFSEVEKSDIDVELVLTKQTNMMVLEFEIAGQAEVLCDRCGDPFMVPLRSHETLIVKLGDETRDAEDDVIILGPQEFEIDIAQHLYEYAHLALPAKHVHDDPESCNQEVVKELEKYRVDRTSSSQWADLKNLNYEDPEDKPFFDEEE